MKTIRKKNSQNKNKEVLINEAYLTDARRINKGDFLTLSCLVYSFLKYLAFRSSYMFQSKFAVFKNRIVLHLLIVIFNMNITSEIIVRILTALTTNPFR